MPHAHVVRDQVTCWPLLTHVCTYMRTCQLLFKTSGQYTRSQERCSYTYILWPFSYLVEYSITYICIQPCIQLYIGPPRVNCSSRNLDNTHMITREVRLYIHTYIHTSFSYLVKYSITYICIQPCIQLYIGSPFAHVYPITSVSMQEFSSLIRPEYAPVCQLDVIK